ncbi:hypothetical protein XELAEV_18044852mg [Xenopus laevis]|nr:hypothetical protein XELAEV_18044852mg [Xenopus laevis]
MTNYFTALENIVSFLSDNLNSSNNSIENIVMGISNLLLQELRLFNGTTFVADWLESLPLQNINLFLSNSFVDVTATQSSAAQMVVLNLVSKALGATSYTQAISSLSNLTTYVMSNTGAIASSSINLTPQLLTLVEELAIKIQNVSLTGPYENAKSCLMNTVSNQSSGQLEEMIQIIQAVFTQSNESANASLTLDLLKEKIQQLQNLTTLICRFGDSDQSHSYCNFTCQYQIMLKSAADLAISVTRDTVTTVSTTNTDKIAAFFDSLLESLQEALLADLSSMFPTSISNITSTLNAYINETSPSFTANLGNLFTNTNQVDNQLNEIVKINNESRSALLNVPIPNNFSQIIDGFMTLDNCRLNASIVTEPFRVFCNLSSEQGYEMAIIFLQNVNIFKMFYRLLVPTTLQTTIDLILTALNKMINDWNAMLAQIPPEQELQQMLDVINTFMSMSKQSKNTLLRKKRSTDTRTITITEVSKSICSNNFTSLRKALQQLYSTNTSSAKSASLTDTYGIPTDNAFCTQLFMNLVSTTSGTASWLLLKPLLYGQILYTPNTILTQQIMQKANATIQQVVGYKANVSSWDTSIQQLLNQWDTLQNAESLIGPLQVLLSNSFINSLLEEFLHTNASQINSTINSALNIINLLKKNMNNIKEFQPIAVVLNNLLSCMTYNRIQPMNSVEEMQAKAEELQKNNQLFAAVTFDLPSETSGQNKASSNLPKHIKYTISMEPMLSEDTSVIRESYWTPVPASSMNKYSRGFVYLQENIDRAIIEMQTNKSVTNIGLQYQPMPYPCYKRDRFLASMGYTLPIALMITWVLFISAFIKKIVHEKEMRLHEYMRMMGVNSNSHFCAWFIESAAFLLITLSILVMLLKFGKMLPNSNGFILFLLLLDYSLTIIAMSYLISVFFHNTNVAGLSGSLIYIITFFPFIVIVTKGSVLSFSAKTLLCIFSPTALSNAIQYVVYYEEQGVGIQWSNMYISPLLGDSMTFGWLCWLLLIDSMIYFLVGFYIRMVFPGKYGIPAPWYFPFQISFWLKCCGLESLRPTKSSGLMFTNIMADNIYHRKGAENDLCPLNEQEPNGLTVGVSLHGLTKVFQSKTAVKNLNLNFYEGHITALLGHNGAGKTTTLSMLTGLYGSTSGTIYVYGDDIRTNLDRARSNMGVCMQYDVHFDHLTTKEHLLLYGSIKAPQWSRTHLHDEVKRNLKDTGLYNHRHKPVKALSGGMKRKLSICMALIGGSKVVILDEPTTGVDPCSRRSIWEVISKQKKDKTIILSTHHLDEAEVLSDRIAFLEQGGLKCCGSPMYLKEKFGSGYHLTLTKKFPNRENREECNVEAVTDLIKSHISEAHLKEDVGGELVYILPPFNAEISGAYLSLLQALDSRMNDLHIGCYGISDTTIEEVFLKLTDGLNEDEEDAMAWSNTKTVVPIPSEENVNVQDELSLTNYRFSDRDDQPLTNEENLFGVSLLLKKIMAILIKRLHNSRRNWRGLISQVLLPVLFVVIAMGLGSLSSNEVSFPELLLTPNLYGTSSQSVAFGHTERTSNLVSAMNSFPGIDNSCLNQNANCLSQSGLGLWTSDNQSLSYGSCNCSTGAPVCDASSAAPPHRRTFSEQMLYNVSGYNMENYLLTSNLQFIQQRYGGWSFGIPWVSSTLETLANQNLNMTISKVWFNNKGPHSLPAFINSFDNFLLRANLPSNKSDQYSISVASKPLSGTVMQASTTVSLVNTLIALCVLVGYSITTSSFATYVVKEHHSGAKRLQHIAGVGETCYWVTNFIYDSLIYLIPVSLSIATIAIFKLPAFYTYPNLGAMSLLFILFGYATFSWMYLLAGSFKNPGSAFITYVSINLFIGINTIISTSVVYFLLVQRSPSDSDYQSLNQTYTVLTDVFKVFPQFCFGYGMILLSQKQAEQIQLSAFGGTSTTNIFSMDVIGWFLSAMVIQGTFLFLLRLLIHDGIIFSVKSFIKRNCMKSYLAVTKNPEEDEDVSAERERVDSGQAATDLLQLQGLTKVYHHVGKSMVAVNNMTLSIPAGECFGLLGVNGAGKTTTFKMLTGDVAPSKGNIQVRNNFGNLENILGYNTDWSAFGYCPQEDALDELLTGEEHLYFYARLHGIPEKKLKAVSLNLLQKLQLVQYKDRITAGYSCGTRRKLSTALALIGRPSILLLDEPSSGMDPKTKRHLWKIISEEVKEKCAVVLTSHSMEECEALCTRLAIMVKGKFQCIGSLQHIKSRFGSGFTVKMHLKDSSVSVEALTSFMCRYFPNTYLKDQHFTMVEYHVPVTAGGVAGIFDLLEANKSDLDIIHFSVSQTTLDEVFINFAQSEVSPDNSSVSRQELPEVAFVTE